MPYHCWFGLSIYQNNIKIDGKNQLLISLGPDSQVSTPTEKSDRLVLVLEKNLQAGYCT